MAIRSKGGAVTFAAGCLAVLAGALLAPPVVIGGRWELSWADAEVLWTFAVSIALLGAALALHALFAKRSLADILRLLMRRAPRTTAVALGVCISAAIWPLLECAVLLLSLGYDAPEEVLTEEDHYIEDDLLGYALDPGSSIRSKLEIGGRTIYDVTYDADDFGRRITPSSGPDSSKNVVLFFGGSNAFGQGVEDDETMAHDLGLSIPDHAVYNYAFRGWGPQQMLAMLQFGRLDSLLEGRSVTAIYFFIDDHVWRAAGGMNAVVHWEIDTPRYGLDRDDKPVLLGSFRSSRTFINWLYALASKSPILNYFGADFPIITDAHYHLTARIIEESADLIAEKSEESRFYMVLHPEVETGAKLERELKGSKVTILDYSGMWDEGETRYAFEGDWHPTPLAHRLLAARMQEDIFPGIR